MSTKCAQEGHAARESLPPLPLRQSFREQHLSFFTEGAHSLCALANAHAAIEAHEAVAVLRQLVLKQVQGFGELAEDYGLRHAVNAWLV